MKLSTSVFAFLFTVASGAVWAQQADSGGKGPIKIGDIAVTGSLRSRVYFWDWFQPTAGNHSYAYSGNIFRIGFSQIHDTWDWNAEFAVPFLLGLPSSPTGTGVQQGALGL